MPLISIRTNTGKEEHIYDNFWVHQRLWKHVQAEVGEQFLKLSPSAQPGESFYDKSISDHYPIVMRLDVSPIKDVIPFPVDSTRKDHSNSLDEQVMEALDLLTVIDDNSSTPTVLDAYICNCKKSSCKNDRCGCRKRNKKCDPLKCGCCSIKPTLQYCLNVES